MFPDDIYEMIQAEEAASNSNDPTNIWSEGFDFLTEKTNVKVEKEDVSSKTSQETLNASHSSRSNAHSSNPSSSSASLSGSQASFAANSGAALPAQPHLMTTSDLASYFSHGNLQAYQQGQTQSNQQVSQVSNTQRVKVQVPQQNSAWVSQGQPQQEQQQQQQMFYVPVQGTTAVQGSQNIVPQEHVITPAAGSRKRIRGIVKRWNIEKGYGFLQPIEGGEDVFVHHSVIYAQGFRSFLEGSEVEYEACEIEPGRIRATHVTGPESSFVQAAKRPLNPPVVAVTQQSDGTVVPVQLPAGSTIVQVQPNTTEANKTKQVWVQNGSTAQPHILQPTGMGNNTFYLAPAPVPSQTIAQAQPQQQQLQQQQQQQNYIPQQNQSAATQFQYQNIQAQPQIIQAAPTSGFTRPPQVMIN